MKKLFLRDGRLWYNEFPKEPKSAGAMPAYDRATSAAKASAVEVVNPEYLNESPVIEGQLYDLPEGWTVEIKQLKTWEGPTEKDPFWRCDECCNGDRCDDHYYRKDCPYCKGTGKLSSDKIVRLIPLKEQSSGIAAVGVAEYGELGIHEESLPFLNEDNWVVEENNIPQVHDQLDQLLAGIPAKPIPILDAKRIAENYNYNQVVIIARKIGDNGIEHVTTYGTSKANCDVAAHIGDFLRYEIVKWEKNSVSPPPQATDSEVITKAKELDKAVGLLLNGLAKDGIAIEGFAAAWQARMELNEVLFNRTIETINP